MLEEIEFSRLLKLNLSVNEPEDLSASFQPVLANR